MMPIDLAFCLGIDIVAYVVPRSAASPESSDCAGLNARPSNRGAASRLKQCKHIVIYMYIVSQYSSGGVCGSKPQIN